MQLLHQVAVLDTDSNSTHQHITSSTIVVARFLKAKEGKKAELELNNK